MTPLSAMFGGTGARLIKIGAVILAGLVLLFLVSYTVDRIRKAQFDKAIEAKDRQLVEAETRAKDAEARAEVIQRAIDDKYAEARQLEGRAKVAEDKLRWTKSNLVPLKETYESIRYVPVPVTPVSCVDACRDLAAIGYKCQ